MTCPEPLTPAYISWESWRLAGGVKAERPKNLPQRIPQGWWQCLQSRRPKPVSLPYWMGGKPGLFVTYGWTQNLWTAEQLVTEAKARGFGWIATQKEGTTPAQAAAFTVACRNALVTPGVWEAQVDFGSPIAASQGFDFYIGQVEGPGQYDRVARSTPPVIPHAVVTNFGGLDPRRASVLVDDGWFCITESHIKESPATPAGQQDYATRVLGWPAHMVSPMVGLGGGAQLSDYPGVESFPGWSVFAAEELLT